MTSLLPDYIQASVPNPRSRRAPWYKNTFPSYAGIFLWVGFYLALAGPTLSQASVGVCLLGLVVAGILCFALYYYVPGMLGMQTGRPLYIVGTSTFGTRGGYIMPGLLMGLLQLGWIAVAAWISTDFIMQGLHTHSKVAFDVTAVVWTYTVAWVAIKGIQYVARAAEILNWFPIIMIVAVCWANRGGIASYHPPHPDSWGGFLAVIAIVTGFFATAGAAGADFGMNNRDRRDVALGGFTGIALSIILAGGLPLLSVAGYLGRTGDYANYSYSAAIGSVGALAPVMFFLFVAASFAPNCFSGFIAANSFATMLPRVPRTISMLIGITLSAVLTVTGVARNLVGFFTIVGASFSPICGAMAADYLLAGRRWSGPREGINWAGYAAWAVGFLTGIPSHLPGVPASWIKADRPAPLFSFVAGFVVYLILAKAKLRPALVAEKEPSAPETI